jgi:hypothetical protein
MPISRTLGRKKKKILKVNAAIATTLGMIKRSVLARLEREEENILI